MPETHENLNRRVILFTICLASFLTPFSVSTMNIITPDLADYFSANAVLLAWMNTIFFLSAGVVLMPTAKLCDIFGRKKIFFIGVVGFALTSFLQAASFSIWMLLAMRFLQGISGAFIVGPSMALATAIFPSSERGKALSTVVAAVYVGSSLGPFIGGWLSFNFGWQSVFICFGVLALLIALAIKLFIKGEWKTGETMQTFDYKGTLIYTVGIIALMYGSSQLPSTRAVWLVIAGIMAMVAFVRWEGSTANPILDLTIFKKYIGFTFSSAAALLHYGALTANTLLLSLYLQYIMGYDPHMAGLLLLPQPIFMFFSTIVAGRLSDRMNPNYLACIGAICAFAASVMLFMVDANTPLTYIIACQIVIGVGYGAFVSPNTSIIMGSVPRERYNEASGVAGTMRLLGQTFSMGIIAMIFALVIGRVEITPAIHGQFLESFKVAYVVYAVMCLFVLVLSLPWKVKGSDPIVR